MKRLAAERLRKLPLVSFWNICIMEISLCKENARAALAPVSGAFPLLEPGYLTLSGNSDPIMVVFT